MNQEYVEDSALQSMFGGKYLTMKRCPSCDRMDIDYENFLTLTLTAFKGDDDTNHIYSLRKEYGIQPVAAAGGWGFFKPFGTILFTDIGYYWANIWDVCMEDYIVNHFLNDLVTRSEK